MTDRNVRRGYEANAAAYTDAREPDERERRILDAFRDGLPAAPRVLDAGCGAGDPVLARLASDAAAVGLDFSRALLSAARGAAPAARLVHGDMTALPFAADAFDAAVAVDSVIHVPVDDHPTVFAEFARVLRPGGRLLVTEAPEPFERTNEQWLGTDAEMTWHMAGADATRDHLRDAGFTLVEEWPAPETGPDEPPKPPFFAAELVAGQSGR